MAQPMAQPSALRTGFAVTAVIVVTSAVLFLWGGAARAARGQRELRVMFTDVGALRVGSRVLYNGLDVGYVKAIELRELDKELSGFPQLSAALLPRLPLTDDERARLVDLAPAELDKEVRRLVRGRTMPELLLAVRAEGDQKRYREDDEVSVVITLMGDSYVDVTSGSGPPLPEDRVLVGTPGDAYGRIASGLGQTRKFADELSHMLLGRPGEPGLADQLESFARYTVDLDTMVGRVEQSLPESFDNFEASLSGSRGKLENLAALFQRRRAVWLDALQTGEARVKAWRDDAVEMAGVGEAGLKTARQDIQSGLGEWGRQAAEQKEQIPALVKRAREWPESARETLNAVDERLSAAELALVDGFQEAQQRLRSLRAGTLGLEEKLWYLGHYPYAAMAPPRDMTGYCMDLQWRRDLLRWHLAELKAQIGLACQRYETTDASERARIERVQQLLKDLGEYLETPPSRKKH